MKSNMKLAAEKLIKIADELEREAADNTYFVCDSCNHTASLTDINAKRLEAGKKAGANRIANVTVNDSLSCPACTGKMSYVPTETSQKYYVEAEDDEDIGADIFEPVDEQGKAEEGTSPDGEDAAPIDGMPSEQTPDQAPEQTPEQTSESAPIAEVPSEEKPEEEKSPEEQPADESPVIDYDGNPEESNSEETPTPEGDTPDMGSDEPPALEDKTDETSDLGTPEGEAPAIGDTGAPEGDNPVIEETVTEDTPEDTNENTDEIPEDKKKVEVPKKDVPKFENMPKEAQDAFWKSVQKYSF